jgi:SAM-dependent methyltransferase
MFERFRQRSLEPENLDKGSYTPEEYEGCLVELRRINEWLGDADALRDSLLNEVERLNLQSFSVLDVGAGSGELLRVAAKWAREKGRKAALVGVELNARSAQAIIDESNDFPEISSVRGSGFTLPFADGSFDFAIQSLTLHHFDDVGAVRILREMARVAARGIFVIDLHRDPVAYFFYTTIGRLFLRNRLIREDGALSILKSWQPNELADLGKQAGLADIKVENHFPARLILSAMSEPGTGRGPQPGSPRGAEGATASSYSPGPIDPVETGSDTII